MATIQDPQYLKALNEIATLRATVEAKDAEIAELHNSIGADAVAAAEDRADAAEARVKELEADHIPMDAKLSVSSIRTADQMPYDLLLAVDGESTDQAIDCTSLLEPYNDRIAALELELAEAKKGLDKPITGSCGHTWTLRHTGCPSCFNDLRAENATLERELAVAKDMAVSAIGELAEAKKDTARLVEAAGEAMFQLKIAVERGVYSRDNEEMWMHKDTMTLTRERLRAAIDEEGEE